MMNNMPEIKHIELLHGLVFSRYVGMWFLQFVLPCKKVHSKGNK